MMPSTDEGKLDDFALVGLFNRTRNRAIAIQRPMGSMVMAVFQKLANHPMEMPFTQDDHMVQPTLNDFPSGWIFCYPQVSTHSHRDQVCATRKPTLSSGRILSA